MNEKLTRRNFLSTAGAGAGLLIIPDISLLGGKAPSNKLNIALIGVGGRGGFIVESVTSENVVAICDVDEEALAKVSEVYPKAKHYYDWRKCLDDKNVEAVGIATNDQSHVPIALWAMNRGLHVYLEKPVGITVEETRLLRSRYKENRGKLATQLGTQRHLWENFFRVRELIRGGAIGTPESVQAWREENYECQGYLPAGGEPPSGLHYDLWLGPAPYHPYNPGYFGSCGRWNKYWDFGTGTIGNWGNHVGDLAWNAIEGGLPLTAEGEGDPFNPECAPLNLRLSFRLPANRWRPEIDFQWNQGNYLPETPMKGIIDLSGIRSGAMFSGTRGIIVSDFWNRILIPTGRHADLTYFKPSDPSEIPDAGVVYDQRGKPDDRLFVKEWIDACKGGPEPSCNFDYSAPVMETLLVGVAAWRAGVKLEYDGEAGKVTNNDRANDYLRRGYREGWPLDG